VSRLWKPWFVCRPSQLARRTLAAVVPAPRGYVPLQTSWGASIVADPRRTIGRSIRTTGLYDIAVSETLARLISPGDTVVDAGANIGYMSVLAARAAGARGRVISFEPHPDLFRILQQNVALDGQRGAAAPVACHQLALGSTSGAARLQLPADFAANDGTASVIDAGAPAGDSIEIRIDTLDAVLGAQRIAVLKLDVEGYEAEVLRGADRALSEQRIAHIVFEDHAVEGSEVVRLLTGFGYRIMALGWSTFGPVVRPLEQGRLASPYEAASYVATVDATAVADRLASRGWRVLRNMAGASLQ
jgi:FkbM family methyltransferase